jgi:hypothetical protein
MAETGFIADHLLDMTESSRLLMTTVIVSSLEA